MRGPCYCKETAFISILCCFIFVFRARAENLRAEAAQACYEMMKKVGRSLYQIQLIHGECYMKTFVHCNCKIPLCLIFDLSNLWNKRSSLRLDLSNLWNKQNSLRFNRSRVQNKQGSLRIDLCKFWNKQVRFASISKTKPRWKLCSPFVSISLPLLVSAAYILSTGCGR